MADQPANLLDRLFGINRLIVGGTERACHNILELIGSWAYAEGVDADGNPTIKITAPSDVAALGALFGSGSDGDWIASSGTTTLTRDMYYATGRPTGTAKMVTNGFVPHFSVELDLENCTAGAINNDGAPNSGANGGAGTSAGTLGASGAGANGASGSGGDNNGTQGSQAAAVDPSNGGACGSGGAGGNGGGGKTGGAASAARTPTNYAPIQSPLQQLMRAGSMIKGGVGASGGSSGGGSASGSSATAPGGGSGGGPVLVLARKVKRGASTPVGAIRSLGGASSGEPGGSAGTNAGGFGGPPGAGGGPVHLIVGEVAGTSATGLLSAKGGNGQNGQNGNGTGANGAGGQSGAGGEVRFTNLGAGTTTYLAPSAAVAGSGQTGGVASSQQLNV